MAQSIAWGIIGVGMHVEQRVARAFQQSAQTKLVAVCDCSLARGREFAAQYGVAQAYDSLDQMLRDPQLDALYIATPNNLHAAQTNQAAQAGKHVLCEKPMALTESDCTSMVETCDKNHVKLGVVFQNRYHPAHVEARRLVKAGMLGKVTTAKAQYGNSLLKGVLRRSWRGDPEIAGAGALMGTGLHPIDLLRYLLDSEIVEVRAWCEPAPPEVDEIIYAILRFSSGACGTVISGVVPFSDNDAVLYGDKAKASCKGTVGMLQTGHLLVEEGSTSERTDFPADEPASANYTRLIEAFNRSIREDTSPEVSGYDGLQLCKIANAVLESSRRGVAVKISN